MPLFMLISGYLFMVSEQKREFVELVEYKGKSLIYPILMCSLLNLLLTQGIISMIGGYSAFINSIFGAIPISSLWFLWSVLACSVALAIAVKLSINPVVQGVLIFVGISFVALFPNWVMNIYMYPYFVIGYLYARNEGSLKRARNVIGIVSTIIFIIMMFFFEKKHYIDISGLLGGETGMESLCIDFFRWAIGLFGSLSIAWLSMLLYNRINRGLIAGLERLGKDSLAVYALSVSLLSFWLPRIAAIILSILSWVDWNRYIWLYNLVITPGVAIAYSILLLLIVRGLKKFGAYRLIFGR